MNEDKIFIQIKMGNPNKLKNIKNRIFTYFVDPSKSPIDFKKILLNTVKIKLQIQQDSLKNSWKKKISLLICAAPRRRSMSLLR